MDSSRKGSEQAKDKAVDSQLTAQGQAANRPRTVSGTSVHRHEVERPVQPAREGRDVDIEGELPVVQNADMGHRSDGRPRPMCSDARELEGRGRKGRGSLLAAVGKIGLAVVSCVSCGHCGHCGAPGCTKQGAHKQGTS